MERQIAFCVTAEQMDMDDKDITSVEVFGSWNGWGAGVSLK